VLVPLTLKYLGTVEFGLWLTISSVITWFSFLDFGIGNGLRNKLAEEFAGKSLEKARIYISTAYAMFGTGTLILCVIFFFVYRFINWSEVFNAPLYLKEKLNLLLIIVFVLFSLQLLLKLIYAVNQADQRPAVNGFISAVISIFSVLFLLIIYKTASADIVLLGTGLSIIPVVILLIATLILFVKFYKTLVPGFKYIQMKYSRGLAKLGLKFFIIQIAGLIVFSTDNMIIVQIFGPSEVTTYNIAYKLFYFVPIFFSIILTPLWSAYTEAYVTNDFQWIRNSTSKIIKIWAALSLGVVLFVFASSAIYKIWVGGNVKIPFYLSAVMGLFVILSNWNNIFTYFLNGVGKIQLQIYSSIFIAVINIPLSIYFAKNLGMGITGVMAATCVCIAIGSAWAPLQYYKIINKKDSGIWSK
jgi:O-antigen/teichoic acid export membrane protein